jgi:hypothetical protein
VKKSIAFPRAHGLLPVGLLVCLGLVTPDIAPAADGGTPSFLVRTADGKAVSGPLLKLDDKWEVRLGVGSPAVIPAGELVVLRRAGKDLPDRPAKAHLLFTNGDCTPVRDCKLDGEKLCFRLDGKDDAAQQAPLSAVSVYWLAPPGEREERDKLRRRWAADKRTRDVIRLRNGDAVEGILTDLDDSTAKLEFDGKKTTIELSKVAAITFSTELAFLPKAKAAYGRVILANGARLSLAKVECTDGQTIAATTLFNTKLNIPVEELVALYMYQGKAVYLSDLKPSRIEGKPFGNLDWPPVADGSVSGLDLRLAGSAYDKGMGLHSDSRVSYNLAGGYRWFEAVVGLEEQSDGRKGSARVKVLVDGKPQPIEGDEELTSKSKPLPIRLDVQGAKELTLVVEFGKRGDVLGRVNWVDARVIK